MTNRFARIQTKLAHLEAMAANGQMLLASDVAEICKQYRWLVGEYEAVLEKKNALEDLLSGVAGFKVKSDGGTTN